MLGLTKVEPSCFGCGVVAKLSRKGMCNHCEWAISQAHDLNSQKMEIAIRSNEIKHLNDCLTACQTTAAQAKEAAHIEHMVLIEENARLRSNLIKAWRRIKTLEGVKSE